jgi:glyoxylase-like metal-dependent hydrolase (beta-lactamase superfamily II)
VTHDWTAPGAFEVVPGVHRIPLPMPNDGLHAVNVYALTSSDGVVLVDSGVRIPLAREGLTKALKVIGADLTDITRCLVTHAHGDHYGQALGLRQEYGIPVTLGADERASIEVTLSRIHDFDATSMREGMLRTYGGAELIAQLGPPPRPDASNWEFPDDWFNDGDVVSAGGRTLEVVNTPGHTRGHVVFYDTPASVLFAGDHVLPTITPSIGFEPAPQDNPLGAFLTSLAIVRQRPDAMLLPAHGMPTTSVHDRVDQLVEHHRLRLDAMAAVLGWGVDTAYDVASRVTWTRRERAFADRDLGNQVMAVMETGAHLTMLEAQGRVTRKVIDGIQRYTLLAA